MRERERERERERWGREIDELNRGWAIEKMKEKRLKNWNIYILLQ
jgi:hypothetical protein